MTNEHNSPSDAWFDEQHEHHLAELQERVDDGKQQLSAETKSRLAALILSAADELAKQRRDNCAAFVEELKQERAAWRQQLAAELAADQAAELAALHKTAQNVAQEQCKASKHELKAASTELLENLKNQLDAYLHEQQDAVRNTIAELKQTAFDELKNEAVRLQDDIVKQSAAAIRENAERQQHDFAAETAAFLDQQRNTWQEQLDASCHETLERLKQSLEQAGDEQQGQLAERAETLLAGWHQDLQSELAPLAERLSGLEPLAGKVNEFEQRLHTAEEPIRGLNSAVKDIRHDLAGARDSFGKLVQATKTAVGRAQSQAKANIEQHDAVLRQQNAGLKQAMLDKQSQLEEQQRLLEESLRAQQQESIALKNWLATASLKERLFGRYPPE